MRTSSGRVLWLVVYILPVPASLAQQPLVNIGVVHDDWFTSGGERYADLMMEMVLREVETTMTSVHFTTFYLPPGHIHSLYAFINSQRAVGQLEQDSELMGVAPVLHVAWDSCRGVHQQEYNTVILQDYSVNMRYICLTWLLRAWVTATITSPASSLNLKSRLYLASTSKDDFVAEKVMHDCTGKTAGSSFYALRQRLQGRTLTVATI
ncbi:putative glutamate receptor ionotropic, delta-1-like 45, partial [Homarus americanus]